ncbi:hypothetical protein U0070_000898, partial [Myodes glareolus]
TKSKCPSYVGVTGILLQETKHVFTKEDHLKVVCCIPTEGISWGSWARQTKRTRENNFKKTEELKQFRKSRVGKEAHHPRTKRRRDPPVLSHHSFKKPQTHPSMYMRQSMKDFHLFAPFIGTECALWPSVPVLRNVTPSAGSVYNFYGVSTPALFSTGISEKVPPEGKALFLDTRVTIIDQNTTLSFQSVTVHCDNIFHPNALVASYPTLSACLVQATASNGPDQRYILAPCYRDGSQAYYNDQNSLGPPVAEELWQCLWSVPCSGNQASSLHPEMVMALKEIQPMNIQTPFSTSAIYCPTAAQSMPDTSLQIELNNACNTSAGASVQWCTERGGKEGDDPKIDTFRSDTLSIAEPKTSSLHEDMLKEDDPETTEGAIDCMANHVEGKSQIFVPKRPSIAWAHQQDKAKETRENNSKKTEELKPSRHRVKAEEKPTIPKTKRKRNPPELSHDSFKKPRTHLGRHMLESVQVFHPLGKKSEKKTGISTSQALLNFSSNKDPRTGPTKTSLGDVPHEGQGPSKTPGNALRTESSAHKECPPPSQDELSPPGKVKLVPLPFLAMDKPQARPVSTKLHCLASHRPTTAYPATQTQAIPTSSCHTSLLASDKSTLPIATSTTRPIRSKPIQSCTGPQLPASLSASYRASSYTSLHREPLSFATNKTLYPIQPQSQYLLRDFSHLPIPWRKVNLPGPVTSQSITEEQRPEKEAMKRWAQQERENAAKCTSLGNHSFSFRGRKIWKFQDIMAMQCVLHWNLRKSTTRRKAPFLDTRVTIIDQNTTHFSRSMTAQCDNIFNPNALVPSYATLSACLETPPHERNQGDYYDQNSLIPLMAGETGQCLEVYGSVSCSGNQASCLHLEMVMALKETQPKNIQTPFSTSAIYCPTSAQAMPEASLQ